MSGIYDAVQNPIPTSNMWVTPKSIDELMERLQNSTCDPKELALMMHGAMFALNCAHYLVETEILNKKVFA